MRYQGTQTEFKNELLHSKFGLNYNDLPQQFRKVSNSINLPAPQGRQSYTAPFIVKAVLDLLFHL